MSSLLALLDAPEAPSVASSASPRSNLTALAQTVANCSRCGLCSTRTQTVFSRGNPEAKLVLIGEGPGEQEDLTGLPFVGRAGQLLDHVLASVQIDRDQDIYICNIVKCRPPKNRKPLPEEMQACKPYLLEQVQAVAPRLILLAGATAVEGILGDGKQKVAITKIRGQWLDAPFTVTDATTGESFTPRIMPIFHPSYLLRNPSKTEGSPKWLMWQDIQTVRQALDALAHS
jgi:uracil-DNA glycosylase